MRTKISSSRATRKNLCFDSQSSLFFTYQNRRSSKNVSTMRSKASYQLLLLALLLLSLIIERTAQIEDRDLCGEVASGRMPVEAIGVWSNKQFVVHTQNDTFIEEDTSWNAAMRTITLGYGDIIDDFMEINFSWRLFTTQALIGFRDEMFQVLAYIPNVDRNTKDMFLLDNAHVPAGGNPMAARFQLHDPAHGLLKFVSIDEGNVHFGFLKGNKTGRVYTSLCLHHLIVTTRMVRIGRKIGCIPRSSRYEASFAYRGQLVVVMQDDVQFFDYSLNPLGTKLRHKFFICRPKWIHFMAIGLGVVLVSLAANFIALHIWFIYRNSAIEHNRTPATTATVSVGNLQPRGYLSPVSPPITTSPTAAPTIIMSPVSSQISSTPSSFVNNHNQNSNYNHNDATSTIASTHNMITSTQIDSSTTT